MQMFRLTVLAISLTCSLAHAQRIVRYQQPESPDDPRATFPLKVLRLALDEAGGAYVLRASPNRMQQGRALAELENGRGQIDLVWTAQTAARDAHLRRIAVALDGGLLGWRVALVKPAMLVRVSGARTLGDLRTLRACIGHDWPDREVFERNGLPVVAAAGYDTLFALLTRGACDYFPRAVSEAWQELAARPGSGVVVAVPGLIHYDQGLYFFVNVHNTALSKLLESGLRKAVKDGSLGRLRKATYPSAIAYVQDHRRDAIELIDH